MRCACSTTCRASPPPASPAATWCATRWWRASSTPTTARPKMNPELALSVQSGVAEPRLPRWRLRRWARRALDGAARDGLAPFARAELSLRLVGQAEGRRLNRDYRARDYATNVLTFEYGTDPLGTARGDILIRLPFLARESRAPCIPLLYHAAPHTVARVLADRGCDHSMTSVTCS